MLRPGDAVPFERATMVRRLADDEFDVLVVGGGITGVGVALDAASRGLRTALVERHDFASGTSSKSSKLVHGGLRYLQQGDVRLVYQALHERQRLLRNAPHLVHVLPFLVPVLTKDGPISAKIAKAMRTALWTYDLTGGLRIGRRHRRVDAETALRHCPTLPASRLSSGFIYYDAATDDARLTLTVARTAARHGAVIANRCEVVKFTRDEGVIDGAVVEDQLSGARFAVRAKTVISATGVWADAVSRLGAAGHAASIRPAKGVHLTIPWRLVRNDIAVIISVPNDKRSLFLVPWGRKPDGTFEHCYVGTTDTDYDGSLETPRTDDDDVAYVLAALNHSLTNRVTEADITATWAGLRPLVAGAESARTADMSRRHQVTTADSGLITVTGGKLTTYRQMAADAVDVAVRSLSEQRRSFSRSRTKRLRLFGGEGFHPLPDSHPDARLANRYGTQLPEIKALVAYDESLGKPLVPGLRYLRAEAIYAVRREMATTLCDVLMRRTRAHLEDRAACMAAASDVANLLAAELGWTPAKVDAEVADYLAVCEAELAATQAGGVSAGAT